MITLQEFKQCEIIIARISEVQEHPDADKLYVLKVDNGRETKQLVAGIRSSYTKEELIGRQIVIIDNLQPAVIRGQESQGMLLAVGDEQGIALLKPDREVPLGSMVR